MEFISANDTNFDHHLDDHKAIIVDFWSPTCVPCKLIEPGLRKIASDYHSSVKVVKVNVNDSPRTSSRYLVRGLPTRARVHYNLGLLLQKIRRDDEAEVALKSALAVEPNHPDYLYALTVFYMQHGQLDEARQTAQQLRLEHPDMPAARELLNAIDQRTKR